MTDASVDSGSAAQARDRDQIPLRLREHPSEPPGPDDVPDRESDLLASRRPRIRCPLCDWEPDGKPYWICERCFTRFDTFETRAHCPKCPNSWKLTQCIACGELTPHEAWYVDDEA